MANNLRVFNLISDYNETELVKPSVSFVVENGKVYYDDVPSPTFQGKWLATYQDSHTSSAECDSSSEIVIGDISITNLVSVEIGDCVTSIGRHAFGGCSSLTSITISNSVTSIGTGAFGDCSSLTSITISNSVTSIGELAFLGCSGITSIDIPNSVTSIGDNAFSFCSGMATCTIGSGVTSIGNSAFAFCTSLTSITIEATTPPTLGDSVFEDINNCPIYVPSQSVNAYKSASGWSYYASMIYPIS